MSDFKLLTQAVFIGEPEWVKFAVADIDGEVLGFEKDPTGTADAYGWSIRPSFNKCISLQADPVSPIGWQHSLIRRL